MTNTQTHTLVTLMNHDLNLRQSGNMQISDRKDSKCSLWLIEPRMFLLLHDIAANRRSYTTQTIKYLIDFKVTFIKVTCNYSISNYIKVRRLSIYVDDLGVTSILITQKI